MVWEAVELETVADDVVVVAGDVVETMLTAEDDVHELVDVVMDEVVEDFTIGGGRTNGEQGAVENRSLAT